MVFIASLLNAYHERNSMEKKLASLFVLLGEAIDRIPPSLCGRQVLPGLSTSRKPKPVPKTFYFIKVVKVNMPNKESVTLLHFTVGPAQ